MASEPRAPIFNQPIRRRRLPAPQSYRVATVAPDPPTTDVPFYQTAWPNPQRRKANPTLYAWEGILAYLGFEQPPFGGTDQPNPTRRAWLLSPQVRRTVNQPDQPDPPFVPIEFPNPLRARPLHLDFTQGELLRNPANIPRPFAQLLWPNPRGPQYPTPHGLETRTPIAYTWPSGAFPDGRAKWEAAWPNPLRPLPIKPPWVYRVADYPLEPDPPPTELLFRARDWTNPVLRKAHGELYQWEGILAYLDFTDPDGAVSVALPPYGRLRPHVGFVQGSHHSFIPGPTIPPGEAWDALPFRARHAHAGLVRGTDLRLLQPTPPEIATVATGFWLIRARRRMIGDD